jgi:hypothetical protein
VSWETPGAFLLALTVPAVLALWLLRPHRPRRRLPSLLLWPGSPAERRAARPWQRLRSHPLLWLQILAAVLLVLAAARPFRPASAAGSHVLVLLDASGSMRARDVAPDRFGAARQAVLDLARGLGPGQAMTVVRVDERPRVLVARARDAGEVAAALGGETAAYGPPDVGAALALASSLTDGPAEWVLVGDGGLAFPEGATRPAGTSYRVVGVGGPAGNVAVVGLAARQGPDGVALQAGLRNTGPGPVAGALQLLAGGQLIAVRDWRLDAGAETYLAFTAPLPEGAPPGGGPGEAPWYEVRLAGLDPSANALEADDRAWATLGGGAAEPAVLLVSPGSTFLERVLGVHGGLRPFRAAPADWPGLAGGTAYPLVVLDRLWPDVFPKGAALLVGPAVGPTFRPQRVTPRSEHPLLRHVDWSEVRIGEARRVPLDGTWETVVDSDGGPLLAVRTEGGRRQAVLAFDLGQSDLPLRPAFPVLMANLLDWLVPRPDAGPGTVPAGGEVSVDPAPLAQEVWAEEVSSLASQVSSPASTGEAGGGGTSDGRGKGAVELAPPWPPRPFRPRAPGLYRVVQEGDAGRQESLLVAEGYHPQEADLNPRAQELPAAGGAPIPTALGVLPFWPWLVLGVVAVSLVEWWVDARWR